MYHHIRTRN